MDYTTIIGMVAAVLTTISFLPQVFKIHRTKHTQDLSLPMYIIFGVGVFLWMCYGILAESIPIMLANAATFLLCLYIILMKIRYK